MCQSTSCTTASFALHRASRWLVEPCRCLGSLSRSGTLIALTSQWSASCLSVNHAMFAVEDLNHQTSKAKSFGRDGSCCSWFNPNSHHAVMCISSQETTRVDVRANCICATMRCKMESELKYNAFNPSHTCLLARMSSTHEILCSQQEDRPRDALPCCNDYAGSVCRRQCGLRHHTSSTEDPCRHSCHTF